MGAGSSQDSEGILDCTKYSMDVFTEKEQNRVNIVPMVCQFLLSQKEPTGLGKRI